MSSNKAPRFSRLQLDYLNSIFPENTNCINSDELLHNNGKRTVVKHIEMLVEQHDNESNVILAELRRG